MAVTFFHTVKSFTQFLWNWKVSGGHLVDQNTANIRASICGGCHNNVPSKDVRKGCSACNKMGNKVLDGIRNEIISGNKTTSDHRLLACAVCGCDLKITAWMPLAALGQTKEEANAWPSFCWRKAILNDQEL